MSSWYVWASLGLFPVAGQSLYLVNAPSFAQARLDLGGRELAIETDGFVEPEPGGPSQYVQSVTFQRGAAGRSWLTARELHGGGRLQIGLGPEPSAWGTDRPAAVGVRPEHPDYPQHVPATPTVGPIIAGPSSGRARIGDR